MKIAYISAVYPPTKGGMCTVAHAEAAALSQAHDVTVFTLATGDATEDALFDQNSSVRIIRLRGFPKISLSAFVPQLFFMLLKYDVVYAHVPAYGFFEVLFLWKFFTRKKLIVTVHMDPIGTGLVYKVGFFLQKFSYAIVLRAADRIRVSTKRLAKAKFLSTEAIQNKTTVIPFGISLETFFPTNKKAGHVYLFVGRLSKTHYFKGVELLLHAFKTVIRTDVDSELWIVGDGEERQRYEKMSTTLGLQGRVKFLGAISDEELPNIYRNASVMVLPSTDTSETFGLVLLEAMASGVPVIASRLPGVDEVVRDGEVGVLVEPGNQKELEDALISVSENREIWETRGKVARKVAQEYGDWTIIAKRISALL